MIGVPNRTPEFLSSAASQALSNKACSNFMTWSGDPAPWRDGTEKPPGERVSARYSLEQTVSIPF